MDEVEAAARHLIDTLDREAPYWRNRIDGTHTKVDAAWRRLLVVVEDCPNHPPVYAPVEGDD